jgi:LPS-assembly lipoprotein
LSRALASLLLVGTLLLVGCGFEPLYGEREQAVATEDLLSRVEVPPIADRVGQLVRIELTNRMTPTRPVPVPAFALVVVLSESKANLAVQKDSSATRANLTIAANFTLKQIGSGQELTSGSVRSVNSYDILQSDFATLAAEQDARQRGAIDVADGIVDRLAIFLLRNQSALTSGRAR